MSQKSIIALNQSKDGEIMITSINVINEKGDEIKVDIIMQFKIEELEKEYIVYTINDDGKSEDVYVCISEIEEKDGYYELKLIPEKEKNLVLVFYDAMRDAICGNR